MKIISLLKLHFTMIVTKFKLLKFNITFCSDVDELYHLD